VNETTYKPSARDAIVEKAIIDNLTASEYLALTFAFCPDAVVYKDTATLETVTAIIDGQAVQRDCVTVTLIDKRADAQQEQGQ